MNKQELLRYDRHFLLTEVGMAGQEKLKASSVLLVGAGGLGSPLALYLAAAGVGRIGIVDFDIVAESNLQRQVLYSTKDLGKKKVDRAAARLKDLNPYIEVVAHPERISAANALDMLGRYDLVADGADNFATRYLVNDASVIAGKPLVSASILGFEGQLAVYHHQNGPCYRCLYPEPPPAGSVPSCAENGVLGVLPGILGTLQGAEVLKVLLGIGETLSGALLHVDVLRMDFQRMKIFRNAACPVCGDSPSIKELKDLDEACLVPGQGEISVKALKKKLSSGDRFQLVDVRESHEVEAGAIEGCLEIPLSELGKEAGRLDRHTEVVAYCRSGARSARAAEELRRMGFKAVSLQGGFLAWDSKAK